MYTSGEGATIRDLRTVGPFNISDAVTLWAGVPRSPLPHSD